MNKSIIYLFILVAFTSFIGWYFITYNRSLIIIAGCSEIAADSITIFNKSVDPKYSFDSIRSRCIQDAGLR